MANRYWVGGTGTWDTTSTANWSTTSGGAAGASAPGAADVAIFNANAGAGTVTISEDVTIFSMTLSAAAITTIDWNNKTVNLAGSSATLYVGNIAVAMLNNPTINCTYSGATGIRTITGGTSIAESNAISVKVSAGTDTVTLGSGNNVYKNVDFTGFAGTLNAGNRYFYGGIVYTAGMTLQAVAWGTHSFLATSGTHTITMAGKSPDGGFTFNGVGGTWQFTDALTIPSTRAVLVSAGTVKFKNGTTSTAGSFTFTGTSSSQVVIGSTTSGSQFTLSDASGTNNASYATISDSIATGGATWNAYYANGNIDGGNNVNWNFGGTPVYDAEYGYKLRSFTERGSF